MNDVQLYDKIADPIQAIEKMGGWIAQSGMCGVKNSAAGNVVAMTCMTERINIMEFQRTYHIIEGRPSMRADAMLAEFRKIGGRVKWVSFDNDDSCIADWTFENETTRIGFTAEEVKQAGLLPPVKGSNWEKRRPAMLRARCISKAVRMLAPEINAGYYTPEEVADFEPVRPAPVVTVQPVADVQQIHEQAEPAHDTPQGKLADALDDIYEEALAWLKAPMMLDGSTRKPYLDQGQMLIDLSDATANQILAALAKYRGLFIDVAAKRSEAVAS